MENTASVAVKVTDLHKRYRGGWFGRPVDALQGVSFEVPSGQIFGLLGPNGAGKTTIIKILLGIARATSGTARILNYPAGDRRGRRHVGYLPENLAIAPHQTARTAMEYYGRLSGMDHRDIRRRGSELLETVGLRDRQRESVRQFSKGMRQRLGLAQALLHDPQLLVLDEPTDGLDPIGRSEVRAILQRLRDEGRTVFLNSHLLQEVELVCDRVAILNRGRLQYTGLINDFTSTADNELQLELLGNEDVVRGCLAAHGILSCRAGSDGRLLLSVTTQDQGETDAVVDHLRAQGISILALTRRKKTLEDFFLDVVTEKEQPA